LAQRRQRALELGATEAFDPGLVNVKREVFSRTGRVGPDVVLECSGIPTILAEAIDATRRGGRVVVVGIGTGGLEINPQRLVLFEREVIGALGYRHDVARAVDLISAGRLPAHLLISDRVPLEDAVESAFETLARDRGETLKVLVEVGGSDVG
jgi:(R,R)-butanediol dehydrogenase/meso-butanediol dehydrogenase/diacetyl reductase